MRENSAPPLRLKGGLARGRGLFFSYKSDDYASIWIMFRPPFGADRVHRGAQQRGVPCAGFEVMIAPLDLLPERKLSYFEEPYFPCHVRQHELVLYGKDGCGACFTRCATTTAADGR